MRTTERQTRENDPTIDDMRYDIAETEAMNMSISDIIEMLIYGCDGVEDTSDLEVRDEWNMLFGEKDVDKD